MRQSSSSSSSGVTSAVAIQIAASPADIDRVQNLTTSLLLSSVLQVVSGIAHANMDIVHKSIDVGVIIPTSSSSSVGMIVGIVVGVVVGISFIILGLFFWRRYRRGKAAKDAMATKQAADAAARKYRDQEAAKAAEAAAKHLTSGNTRPIPPAPAMTPSMFTNGSSPEQQAGFVTLRELARARVLQGMMRIVKTSEENAKEMLNGFSGGTSKLDRAAPSSIKKPVVVVVADRRALAVLSAACRLTDLIQEGAFVVESLETERDAMPRMSAVYFVAPIAESFDRLVMDFPDAHANPLALIDDNAEDSSSGASRQGSGARRRSNSHSSRERNALSATRDASLASHNMQPWSTSTVIAPK